MLLFLELQEGVCFFVAHHDGLGPRVGGGGGGDEVAGLAGLAGHQLGWVVGVLALGQLLAQAGHHGGYHWLVAPAWGQGAARP